MNYSEKVFLALASLVLVISSMVLLFRLNNSFLVEVPAFGGSFTEGIVGSPRFINPVLAISDTDKDMVSLIYSGLLKISKDGGLETDLAESYTVTDNGTIYDFIIKDNAYFHDGRKVGADDVIFTVEKVLDPVIKSPRKANWEGVVVEKRGEREVRFTLSKPYAPFLSALTLGILPKHIWEKVSSEEFPFSQINIDPIGSGPYKVEKISRNSGGIPVMITLASWKKYALGKPKIKSVIFKFFQNETELLKAYEEKLVENMSGLSPLNAKKIMSGNSGQVKETSLPRIFGVFLNQNAAPVFLNKEVREALDRAAPKQRIINEVLYGLGQAINGPTPDYTEKDATTEGDTQGAKAMLIAAGWQENENGILEKKIKNEKVLFSFAITTADTPELKKTAEILKETWEKIGASVSIKVFEAGDLSQNIIRLRKYDALLFGEVVGGDSDLYPFWHSSGRNDPGLNVALYANITVDKTLEEIQKEVNNQNKQLKKEVVALEIKKDLPAIFLFSPHLTYITSSEIKNITLNSISASNERFVNINQWFIETDKVWKFFVNN